MRIVLCTLILTTLLCQPHAANAARAQQDAAKIVQPSPNSSRAADAPIANNDVLAMLDAELPADVIVSKIKSSPARFDTSPDALKQLRDAGVPDAVIAAMLLPRDAARAATQGEVAASVSEPQSSQPVPASVKIPVGVRVELEMAHTIDSMTTRTGDAVSLRVVNPVVVDGMTVIAVGATATARVVKAERNGHFGRAGRIVWELKEVTAIDGTRVPLSASGRAVGDSKGAKVAATMALAVLSPVALVAGFKRGENAVVPEGKRFDAFVQTESNVNPVVRR
jgi:hypothetical protein